MNPAAGREGTALASHAAKRHRGRVHHDFGEIAAITFDAAGTLLHPHPSVGAVYREVALAHGSDHAAHKLERAFRTAFRSLSKDDLLLDPEARERDFWRRVVLETVSTTGTPPADFDGFFADLWETFAHAARWRLFPDARETLEVLKARGYRLGVLSNWDRRLHNVLAETGLRPLFDAVVISADAGFEKPDAGIFRAMERALGVGPRAILHIGDSRQHDLIGAHAAGWQALLVRHGEAAGPNELARLGELLDLLAAPGGH